VVYPLYISVERIYKFTVGFERRMNRKSTMK